MANTFKRELSEEGKRMFENMDLLEEEFTPKRRKKVEEVEDTPIQLTASELELAKLKRGLYTMLENSKLVVADCDKLISKYRTKEEYLKSEPKVAKYVHEKFIERITKVLEGQEPFPV